MSTGPGGPLAERFEDGLRFLAAALALAADRRHAAAAVTTACDALRCFLAILDEAARRHMEDPGGDLQHLRAQCVALLSAEQGPDEVVVNALDAARLARDFAARLMPRLQ